MSKYDGDAIAENRNTLGNDDDDAKPRIPARLAWFFQEEINAAGSRSNKTKRRIVSLKKNKFVIDCGAFLGNCGGSLILGDLTPWKTEGKNMDDAKFNAENALRRLKKAGTDEQQSSLEDIPVEEKNFLALLPPRYLGYSLQNKFWGQFSVDRTSAPDEKDLKAFQTNLQLNQEYKDLIKALVSKHDAGNNSDDGQKKVTDIVAGKGKGLVILLHGPPGVGKTLTAETIAEGTGKPLFVVSVAEIGLDAAKAERNLQQMFDLASAWGAILLVDEADVFLESRSSESGTERNALVSVLLRVLEYYHGIMILTTNRIRHLDIAVQSRIHLAIRYQELDKGQKARIFGFYLDQLEADSIYRRDRIDDWVNEYGVEHELNGRQIRNLVSAALALARNEEGDQRVTDKHLKKVAKVVNDFIKELQSTVTNSRMSNEVGLKT
jgi:SpoVK/Ycf46/Vps4 family AAA+-type ATPase